MSADATAAIEKAKPPRFSRTFRSGGRSNRRSFDPHRWTGEAIANHSAISPATALVESGVVD
jgi:hypothetical protein